MKNLPLSLFFALCASASSAAVLHVHDSEGRLGTVDSETGAVSIIGNLNVVLTDIAFDPAGNLFGVSFTDLYRVNENTAEVTLVGPHAVPGGNALVFGRDGTLLSAGSSSDSLFTIDPTTGATTSLGRTGFVSGGDLAFLGDDLFLASNRDQLVNVDLTDLLNSSAAGAFGVPNVFGIATSDNNRLFGVGGTTVFSVDPATGTAFGLVDFGGQGLASVFGQSFRAEAGAPPVSPIPLPAPALMLLGALGALAGLRSRR